MARRKVREWCHWCSTYQEFEYDPEDLGEQKILCPNCGHDHYRRPDGLGGLERTGRQSQQQQVWRVSGSTYGSTTTYASYTYNAITGFWYPRA